MTVREQRKTELFIRLPCSLLPHVLSSKALAIPECLRERTTFIVPLARAPPSTFRIIGEGKEKERIGGRKKYKKKQSVGNMYIEASVRVRRSQRA